MWPHSARIELRVHHDASFLPFQLAEEFLGGAVHPCSIDLVVSVLLQGVQYGSAVFQIVYAGSFGA